MAEEQKKTSNSSVAPLKIPEFKMPNPQEMASLFVTIAEKSQVIIKEFLERQSKDAVFDLQDQLNIGKSFLELTQKMIADPVKLAQSYTNLWQKYFAMWQHIMPAMLTGQSVTHIKEPKGDKRFKHDDWKDNVLFSYIKQSYLIVADWIQMTVADVEGLEEHTKQKVQFYTRQFVDAMSPTNFVLTNPEVLRATVESGGQNLVNGLKNMLDDLERGKGKLNIKMTDLNAFELGKNIAVTPGKVVFQNEMMQLIQYEPSTHDVYKKPFLIFPPWINKYYIMDLRPKNSLVKWVVDQGFTVFLISWVNPNEKMSGWEFGNYLKDGPLAALDAIEQAVGEKEVNALGYCLGGTLLGITNAYLAAKGGIPRISSGTYLTTLLDFAQPGELGVFVDEEQIASLENRMAVKGYMEGSEMATTFSMLRANDLMWSFFINNYLLGKEPFPFDLLYWNSDSTRMPAKMHSFYLRNFYQRNLLKVPGGISLLGTPIDLSQVKIPSYFLSGVEDHISPWTSNYLSSLLLNGPVRFVLSGSGHIAGPMNPPSANKYFYWTNPKHPASAEEWLREAKQTDGSWWPDWIKWLSKIAGDKVPARIPGNGKLPVIEDAPGTYVKMRILK